MGRAHRFAVLCATAWVLVPFDLPAQPGVANPVGMRPTIGLALSGGGARGGAHIGVLLALRELRVPIDYIAGTSMGSVVGGFYASGLDEERLQSLVREADWANLFDDAPTRENRTFHRKRDDELFLVKKRVGISRRRIGLPMGLVVGQDLDVFLARVMLPVQHVESFDELSIPFRAVAADMVTGEAVILEHGSLARAIRASLSIPAVIAPVEIDGRLLGDGGIAQNLPVETVRGMGADIVIAVDISTPLTTREGLTSVVLIAGQLVGFLTASHTAEQLAKLTDHDVLITPQLGDVRAGEFERMQETIAAGYKATMAAADQLSPLALSPQAYAVHRAGRRNPRIETPPRIDFVRLANKSTIADSIIEARLKTIPTGVPLDLDATELAIARVYGLELFDHVGFEVVGDAERKGLEVSVGGQAWGPNYLQFGFESSSTGSDEAIFGVSLSYLQTAMNRLGAEWRTTLQLGDEPGLSTNWHQPLGWNAMTFVSAGLSATSSLVDLYEGSTRIASVHQDEGLLEVAVGREFGTWGELRVGVRRGAGKQELKTGVPATVLPDNFDRGEAFARFTVDTLDSIYFPREGSFLRMEWVTSKQHLGATADFDQFGGSFLTAKSFGRNTLALGARYGSTIEGTAPPWSLFEMGGFWDLSGFAKNELSGQNVGLLLASYYRRFGNIATLPIYAGVTYEKGNTWDARNEISLNSSLNAGSLWVAADTLLGPVYLAYGRAEGGHDSFYIVIGNVMTRRQR